MLVSPHYWDSTLASDVGMNCWCCHWYWSSESPLMEMKRATPGGCAPVVRPWCFRVTRRTCWNTKCSLRLWFSRSGVDLITCISKQFPDDSNVVVLWESILEEALPKIIWGNYPFVSAVASLKLVPPKARELSWATTVVETPGQTALVLEVREEDPSLASIPWIAVLRISGSDTFPRPVCYLDVGIERF